MRKKFCRCFSLCLLLIINFTINCYAFSQTNIVDTSNMIKTVDFLSKNFRGIDNEQIASVRGFIINAFASYGLDVSVQTFEYINEENNKYVAKNIIGSIKPINNNTQDILIIGAHYDGANDTPAANDNASGISVLLELARVLSNITTDTEIRFVAFDLEEPGLIGSQYYVENLGEDIEHIIGMLNFDMLADKTAEKVGIYTTDGCENYLSDILKNTNGYEDIQVEEYSRMGISDHNSFYSKRIPVLFFSHPPIWEHMHNNEDVMENISIDMLKYTANAGYNIISKIMSEDTPSYQNIINVRSDTFVYPISLSTKIPVNVSKIDFENITGIKLNQIISETFDSVYEANIKLFDSDKIFKMVAIDTGTKNRLDEIFINVSDDKYIHEIFTQAFKAARCIDSNGKTIYMWDNIYGNTYVLENMRLIVQPYMGFEAEGYTLQNNKLIRLKDANSYAITQKINLSGDVIEEIINNEPSSILSTTDYAQEAWDKVKAYLTNDEISKVNFIRFFSDGLNGGNSIIMEEFEQNENLGIETVGDNSIERQVALKGIQLNIDYMDIIHPQGNCYNTLSLEKQLATTRIYCNGRSDVPSDWAVDSIIKSIENDILLFDLTNQYKYNISRLDFCKIAYQLLKNNINESPISFVDTNSEEVFAMAGAGIINGKAENIFAPTDTITREEAAVILFRMAEYLNISDSTDNSFRYSDDYNISDWANEAVYKINALGIMNGVGDNNFEPKSSLTKEQAIVTIMGLYGILI